MVWGRSVCKSFEMMAFQRQCEVARTLIRRHSDVVCLVGGVLSDSGLTYSVLDS